MRFGLILRVWATLVATGAPALAQQPAADGTTPSTYRSYIVVDQRTEPDSPQNRTGKLHDLVNENNLNPVIAVFANKVPAGGDEPLAKLTKVVKEIQNKYKADEFGAFVIFAVLDQDYVTDPKADATAAAIDAWAKTVQPGGVVLGLAKRPDGKEGDAQKWNLSADATTVVFYNRHKIIKRWDVPVDGITDQVIAEIAGEADRVMKK